MPLRSKGALRRHEPHSWRDEALAKVVYQWIRPPLIERVHDKSNDGLFVGVCLQAIQNVTSACQQAPAFKPLRLIFNKGNMR